MSLTGGCQCSGGPINGARLCHLQWEIIGHLANYLEIDACRRILGRQPYGRDLLQLPSTLGILSSWGQNMICKILFSCCGGVFCRFQ